MITVYGGWPTRSQRVVWLLEEMKRPYSLRLVDLRNRGADAELQSANPAGFLPVLFDGEVRIVESIAIMEYLLARYGLADLAPGPSDGAFACYQQFLHLGEAGLAAQLNVVVASKFFAPESERDNFGAKMAVHFFLNRLSIVAAQLEISAYLAGDAFTAADISVCYALELGGRLGLATHYSPAIVDYMRRLSERPAYQRALAKSPPPSSA
jgi:glutathione S-transferase